MQVCACKCVHEFACEFVCVCKCACMHVLESVHASLQCVLGSVSLRVCTCMVEASVHKFATESFQQLLNQSCV